MTSTPPKLGRGAAIRVCNTGAPKHRARVCPTLALIAAVLSLAAVPASRAELKWESREQAVTLRPTDTVANVCYVFTNAGDKAVTITEVHPGCGCTVPSLAKNTYAPGERGELKAAFHPGSREGTVSMPITVSTDDSADPTTLILIAQIETVLHFDTHFVSWKGTEPRTPKFMRMTVAKDLTALLSSVQCSSPQFTATFRPIGDTGREYEITVTPPADVNTYTAITVRTLLGTEKTERNFTVVARTF
jgi:hypothetical protein